MKTEASTFKEEYIAVNGIRLHCVVNGEGKLIVFLHGFPEFWYVWRNQLAEFGKDYMAVAPDMRGYNLSDKPKKASDYELPLLVSDVVALIEKLGKGKKAILVAHDWGGAVAWNVAITHPECLEKLVIINAPHPATFLRELKTNPKQRKASSYMALFASGLGETVLKANNYQRLKTAIFEKSAKPEIFSESEKEMYVSAWSQPGAIAGGLSYYRAFACQSFKNIFGKSAPRKLKVTVPTLVIWGEKDTALLPGNLDGLENYVSNLQVKRIPDGTHWVIHEQPDLINRYIREFIAS